MKTRQLRTFLVLLTAGLGAPTVSSSQNVTATPATGTHADVPKGASANSWKNAGAANEPLPSIFSEEEIPAYLFTDPCDTNDS
jgi:hypothetical protein